MEEDSIWQVWEMFKTKTSQGLVMVQDVVGKVEEKLNIIKWLLGFSLEFTDSEIRERDRLGWQSIWWVFRIYVLSPLIYGADN